MITSADIDLLNRELPDPESAARFLDHFGENHKSQLSKLLKREALLSDVLALAAYSPLLASTLLQNPDHIWWLDRERKIPGSRSKEELLESLARFSLTHSQLEPSIALARFRRRELMRIFLKDIRRLATVAEITDEISNLADAILEHAMRLALQELDNRFGAPQQSDEKGRSARSTCCIVSLGKLGSRELNYSSDIDLLFLYSAEGATDAAGARRPITNREYFVKLAETIVRLIGHQTGEGAAYRVDLRLRPHGRVGPLALPVGDTVKYYRETARPWERQVLIRSRASAGDAELFRRFFVEIEASVFALDENIESALENVRLSKQRIDLNKRSARGTDVKLDAGGIREIEFIAQALQLAHAGRDPWLRASHTLISLARLAERKYISETQLTELYDAYHFLRRLEHLLQMENGLQTHLVPDDLEKRSLFARRMQFTDVKLFDRALAGHTANVHRIFKRVFGVVKPISVASDTEKRPITPRSLYQSPNDERGDRPTLSPRLAALRKFDEFGASRLRPSDAEKYENELLTASRGENNFRGRLGALRRKWSALLLEIVNADLAGASITDCKKAQTALAKASLDTALEISRLEMESKLKLPIERLPIAVLGLGKLGSGGLDYDSDLDLVLAYDEHETVPVSTSAAEFYGRAAEVFINALSSITREGSLYRVDLRLRPYGGDGPSINAARALIEYMSESSAVWEWLAYLKLHAAAGDIALGRRVESRVGEIIHARADAADPAVLAAETRRVRLSLEKQRTHNRRTAVDIKFGAGGMLDIYFAVRYLQLRDNVPDDEVDRSTLRTLSVLRQSGSLPDEDFNSLTEGYRFLSALDHSLRLFIGRSNAVPNPGHPALEHIARRLDLHSPADIIAQLTLHRIAIREAFDRIVL